jgi:histidinol-phosphate aminotransferase
VTTVGPGLPLREDLRELTPYGAPQLDVAVRLNTNENPYPPPRELVADLAAAVEAAARGLNRYPDREAWALRSDLAAYLGTQVPAPGLSAAHVWAANGSNEVLQQLLQAFGGPGRVALGWHPSYSMHRLIARATGTAWITEARGPDFELAAGQAADAVRRHSPDVVFLCSPDNPTGTVVGHDVIKAVLAESTGMVVVDEAYAEFSAEPSAVPLVHDHERLVVTRTMSKAFGFAGARLGYLVAAESVVEAMRLVRLPYHLSELTQAAARAALRHADATLGQVARLRSDRERLAAQLTARGFEVTPSHANFLLVGGFEDAGAVWQGLLDHGVLVRDVGLPGRLRVTVGTTEECDQFLHALDRTASLPAP